MAKPFDAASKLLVEADPQAWLTYLGLPGTAIEFVDTDIQAVSAEPDRVLRVGSPDYLVHIELQASYDVRIAERLLFYSVLARYKYRLPVDSTLVLLRKEADGPAIQGLLTDSSIDFRYRVVRIWESDVQDLLQAPTGMLPMAAVANVEQSELPGIISQMAFRVDHELPEEKRKDFWIVTYLLMGLKYEDPFVREMLKGVMAMRESSTYQAILNEGRKTGREEGWKSGRQEGREEGERKLLLVLASKRLGMPDEATLATLNAIKSTERLEQLAARLLEVETWPELLS